MLVKSLKCIRNYENIFLKFITRNNAGFQPVTLLKAELLNPFHATTFSLWPQKIKEDLWFSDIFRGTQKETKGMIQANEHYSRKILRSLAQILNLRCCTIVFHVDVLVFAEDVIFTHICKSACFEKVTFEQIPRWCTRFLIHSSCTGILENGSKYDSLLVISDKIAWGIKLYFFPDKLFLAT